MLFWIGMLVSFQILQVFFYNSWSKSIYIRMKEAVSAIECFIIVTPMRVDVKQFPRTA
jgi:hypothetical protein